MFVKVNGKFYPECMIDGVSLVNTPRCTGRSMFYEKSGLVHLANGKKIEVEFVELLRVMEQLDMPICLVLG